MSLEAQGEQIEELSDTDDPYISGSPCSSSSSVTSSELPEECEMPSDCHHYDDESWLYSSSAAGTPLFEGSRNTVLTALVEHFHWFTQHPGISKDALSSMLAMQHKFLPTGNNLPSSYEAALRTIEPYLIQPVVYDVCRNDCIVFRKEYESLVKCPKCDSGRYNKSNTPVRRFTYLPIRPRLARLFGSANMAAVLQSHTTLGGTGIRKVYDVQQSKAWEAAYSTSGIFGGDPRGISFAMCTDGVNPFAHNKVTYSMWPIMLTLLNLPRKSRNRFGSIMLQGIIPGNGTKEMYNINPYIDIMVDELLELSDSILFDAYKEAPFRCKVAILLYVLDYPGIGKVMSVVGSGGYQGCAFCHIKGEHNTALCKIVYLQNRRYLPVVSEMRKDKTRYCKLAMNNYNYCY